MLTNTLRKIAIIATMAFVFVGLAACANESEGNDATVDNTTTTTVVTTTTEDKEETEATTTTAVTTAEPEKTEEVTTTTEATTTTEVIETSEPETETEVTTAEEPEEEKYFTVEECLRKALEKNTDLEVVEIEYNEINDNLSVITSDGSKFNVSPNVMDAYHSGETLNVEYFLVSNTEERKSIVYFPQ